MTRRLLLLTALALPLVGLSLGIVQAERALSGASEWRIPITGYDPRDPLRGRYIRFQYAWRLAGPEQSCGGGQCRLCLEEGGQVVRFAAPGASCAAVVDPRASGLTVFTDHGRTVNAATRLWLSEARAPLLESQLRTRSMVAVARLTRGGRLLADRLEPAQSPSAQ